MPSSQANEKLILALPKGRILREAAPLLARAGIEPERAFADPDARQLRFATNHPDLDIIRVRSFDVATFVAFGAAHLGIAGADVLMEFDYPEIYAPIDLGIGRCRLAVAEPVEMAGSDGPPGRFGGGTAPLAVAVEDEGAVAVTGQLGRGVVVAVVGEQNGAGNHSEAPARFVAIGVADRQLRMSRAPGRQVFHADDPKVAHVRPATRQGEKDDGA